MMQPPAAGLTGIRLAELMASLSLATDLAMGQPVEFALAGCVLAVRLGEALGLGEADLRACYYQALLRYIGCNAETHLLAAIVGDEISLRTTVAPVDSTDNGALMGIMMRYIREANAGASPLQMIRALARDLPAFPRLAGEFFGGHCEVAQRLAVRLDLDAEVIRALGQLYERWDGKGLPGRLRGEAIAPAVR